MKQEQFEKILNRDNWVCKFPGCFKRAVEPAHRISQNKGGRAYVKEMFLDLFNVDLSKAGIDKVIHHEFNVVSVCSDKRHNDFFSINFASQPVRAQELIEKIYRDLFLSYDERLDIMIKEFGELLNDVRG